MLNSQLIGSYISKLRKEKDFTQVELAEQLNISHQAVSKWERGESLPDIGTLVSLAALFQTSVDVLLSGGSRTVSSNHVGQMVNQLATHQLEGAASLLNAGDTDVYEFIAIAPLLKTGVIEEVIQHVNEERLNLEHVIQLAPFVNETLLGKLLTKLKIEECSWEQVESLAPFLPKPFLSDLLTKVNAPVTLANLLHLAPFLAGEIQSLMQQIDIEQINWHDIERLAPFISSDQLTDIIQKCNDSIETMRQLVAVAPFLEKEHIESIFLQTESISISKNDVLALAPFVSKSLLERLISSLKPNELTIQDVLALAPFLSNSTIENLLVEK
ncbi:hypothetical protein AWM68_02690 [Fictibacillus phosphorivorans]|uniref:HTH cro/C1-type domain-containing protein n=1 Tax=Fictibacillus phosphorivorans TaxID=1221500 RepID=A0A165P6Y4_9BACL|nr:helix-turn-helix transcriptional regulator [Fictibacillus phosphorivorans]KZE69193.1 hypothetical protein AWM68_02690 [Fictibacillus phosphorivorans]